MKHLTLGVFITLVISRGLLSLGYQFYGTQKKAFTDVNVKVQLTLMKF